MRVMTYVLQVDEEALETSSNVSRVGWLLRRRMSAEPTSQPTSGLRTPPPPLSPKGPT